MTCTCGCDPLEALGACAPPKKVVGTVYEGSVSICANASGISFPLFLIIMFGGGRVVGSIERTQTGNTWVFHMILNGFGFAIGVTVPPEVPIPDCEGIPVSWGINAEGHAYISVQGYSSVSGQPVNAAPGTAYAIASPGDAWTADVQSAEAMHFIDDEAMLFIDAEEMTFAPS